jgi:NAD-dependent dihydropyrimidine dehydrogenase PreA subunit
VKIKGKAKKTVSFDPNNCWGCGLCANACPTEAIEMKQLDRRQQVDALLAPSL